MTDPKVLQKALRIPLERALEALEPFLQEAISRNDRKKIKRRNNSVASDSAVSSEDQSEMLSLVEEDCQLVLQILNASFCVPELKVDLYDIGRLGKKSGLAKRKR